MYSLQASLAMSQKALRGTCKSELLSGLLVLPRLCSGMLQHSGMFWMIRLLGNVAVSNYLIDSR